MQFLAWSLLLAPHAVQGDQERPFLSRELRRGVLTQGEKRISRDRALVIEEERRGAVRMNESTWADWGFGANDEGIFDPTAMWVDEERGKS